MPASRPLYIGHNCEMDNFIITILPMEQLTMENLSKLYKPYSTHKAKMGAQIFGSKCSITMHSFRGVGVWGRREREKERGGEGE